MVLDNIKRMTYKEFIHKCGKDIGRPERWPQSDADGPVSDFHLGRVYLTVLAVYNFLSLPRLVGTYGLSASNVNATQQASGMHRLEFPADVLYARADFGIDSFSVAGRVYQMQEASDFRSVVAANGNAFQTGNVRFTVTPSGKSMLWTGLTGATQAVELSHVKVPAAPVTGSETWPLKELDTEAALQVVAAHAAMDSQDAEMFKAHQLLSNFYNGQE